MSARRLHRSADFQVCCIAGFQTRVPSEVVARLETGRAADLEIGDTAGLETCATDVDAHARHSAADEVCPRITRMPANEEAAIALSSFASIRVIRGHQIFSALNLPGLYPCHPRHPRATSSPP